MASDAAAPNVSNAIRPKDGASLLAGLPLLVPAGTRRLFNAGVSDDGSPPRYQNIRSA
jgi:hypothetical protein